MKSLAWIAMIGLGLGGCDSNPTPHPQGDATARADTMEPAGEGPDDDDNGVPDCAEAGGFWTGDTCRNDIATPDASVGDTLSEVADTTDGDDASEGDGGDADPDVSDSGPDVAE